MAKKSSLKIIPGTNVPSSINPDKNSRKKKKQTFTTEEIIKGILAGERVYLSRGITLVESILPAHQEEARKIIEACLPHAGHSVRVGITGVPGAGKSTFIEALGMHLIEKKQKKLAVLAIDPSSIKSKGSILGDKTRMEKLAAHPQAFIRPSPTSGSLGGISRKTREAMILCEAAGYNTIFIETVGVGQSEIAVHSMVDFFLLLMIAGAGDELQGIKRGIIEMSDLIVINKWDENPEKVEMTKKIYENALHLFPAAESGFGPHVLTCSALTGKGIDRIASLIQEYIDFTISNGYFDQKRKKQATYWLYETLKSSLMEEFFKNPEIKERLSDLENKVTNLEISPFLAAQELIRMFKKDMDN